MSKQSTLAIVILSLFLSVLLGGCDGGRGAVAFPNAGQGSSSAGSPTCNWHPSETVDQKTEAGEWSLTYGTIRDLRPVLDRFDNGSSTCRGEIYPALRITLEVQEASWDFSATPQVVVEIPATAWNTSDIYPYIPAGSSRVQWSDRHEYFWKGADIVVMGYFLDETTLNASKSSFLSLDDEGRILYARVDPCNGESLNGRSFSEIAQTVREVNKGEKLFANFDPPRESMCD